MKIIDNIYKHSHLCTKNALLIFLFVVVHSTGLTAQESIFTSFKNDQQRADEYFENDEYTAALDLYLNLAEKNKGGKDIDLKIARTFYYSGNYCKTVNWYEKYLNKSESLPLDDYLKYADALCGNSNYEEALKWYKQYSKIYPEDQITSRKVSMLSNLAPYYSDSSLFEIKPLKINSPSSDICLVPSTYGLVFLSDRKRDEGNNKRMKDGNYFKLYYSTIKRNISGTTTYYNLTEPVEFLPELKSEYHQGPIVFYDKDTKIVFSATSVKNLKSGEKKTLHLLFAEKVNGRWTLTSEFPYNSSDYSVSDPAISSDGMTLYFSSDMQQGHGGKDLYRSEMRNGIWSQPVNLGPSVNTYGDECFPFVLDDQLYFSSNGHAGLGGLDIYKMKIGNTDINSIHNLGYPINTNFDDFGIFINEDNKSGYLTSNRNNEYFNDDLYAFEVSSQNFPLMINGSLKYKEQDSTNPNETRALPNTELFLIDHIRNVTVHESSSDSLGNFSIRVPYFSEFKIKIVEESGNTSIVDLEILEHQQVEKFHEIVVVKDNNPN